MKETNNPAENKVSAYIHIPFCEHICYYCDFNKVFLEGQPVDEYVEMLLNEMRLMLESHPTANLETLYVGAEHRPLYLLNNLIDCYQELERSCLSRMVRSLL